MKMSAPHFLTFRLASTEETEHNIIPFKKQNALGRIAGKMKNMSKVKNGLSYAK
jgi:hypothetical protein